MSEQKGENATCDDVPERRRLEHAFQNQNVVIVSVQLQYCTGYLPYFKRSLKPARPDFKDSVFIIIIFLWKMRTPQHCYVFPRPN